MDEKSRQFVTFFVCNGAVALKGPFSQIPKKGFGFSEKNISSREERKLSSKSDVKNRKVSFH